MLIHNANLITWGSENQILQGYSVYIEGDKIFAIAPDTELAARYPNVRFQKVPSSWCGKIIYQFN